MGNEQFSALGPHVPRKVGNALRNRSNSCAAAARQSAFNGMLAGLREALGTGEQEANVAAIERVDDWNAVARMAARNRVCSLLRRGLHRSGTAAPQAGAALGSLCATANARGLSQLAGMRAAVDCLDRQGIPSLAPKGLPLGARLFGSPLARECYDIDLLIPPSLAVKAVDALSLCGWEMRAPLFEPTPTRDRFFQKYVSNRIFSGPGGTLELHHRLTNNPFVLPVGFADLAAGAKTVEAGGSSFRVLGDSDLFLYLCIHGEMHRWSRLKWLCDIAAMIALLREDGLVEALSHCRRRGLAVEPVFETALRLCRDSLQVELPAAAASLASGAWAGRRARKTWHLWNRPGGGRGLQGAARRIDQWRTALLINPCWRSNAWELARMLAPPYDLGRINLPDRLFFLYWPLRPVLLFVSWLERCATRHAGGRNKVAEPDSRQTGSAMTGHAALMARSTSRSIRDGAQR